MKLINLNAKLLNIYGDPLPDPDFPMVDDPKNPGNKIPAKDVTLKSKIIISLNMPTEGDKDTDKYAKYDVFKKVRDAKSEVELTAEEITLIKKCIGKHQPQLIAGQCRDLIEASGTEDNIQKKK